jgi:hypothetical protein
LKTGTATARSIFRDFLGAEIRKQADVVKQAGVETEA